MSNDELPERISPYDSGAQDAQDAAMDEVADWLRRSHQAGEAEHNGQSFHSSPHGLTLPEHIAAESYAIEHGLWFDDVSSFGTIGPSGDEFLFFLI